MGGGGQRLKNKTTTEPRTARQESLTDCGGNSLAWRPLLRSRLGIPSFPTLAPTKHSNRTTRASCTLFSPHKAHLRFAPVSRAQHNCKCDGMDVSTRLRDTL